MNFRQLIERADEGHKKSWPLVKESDDWPSLLMLVDEHGNPDDTQSDGDEVALFIVHKLFSEFNEEASDEQQLATAAAAIKNAIDDMQNVLNSLESK